MKALALFSGGLDSILAIKLLQEQGIKIIAYHFTSPVLTEDIKNIKKTANELGVKLIIEEAGFDYFKMLRKPKHGYGSAINPCIDCRIFVFKKAKKVAKKEGAKFIATGEVLGERPMTQVKDL
jgi:tRNA U34 2-thiouridine synthase MnmA/TrmU